MLLNVANDYHDQLVSPSYLANVPVFCSVASESHLGCPGCIVTLMITSLFTHNTSLIT